MTPAEIYPPLKHAHVALVSSSGLLFAARGLAVVAGQSWPGRPAWRRLSVAIDSALLGAGASLWWLLQLNPLHDAWLGSKLLALVGYIVLGSLALKRGRTPAIRALCLVAALTVFLWMVSVARSHHPAGWFHLAGVAHSHHVDDERQPWPRRVARGEPAQWPLAPWLLDDQEPATRPWRAAQGCAS